MLYVQYILKIIASHLSPWLLNDNNKKRFQRDMNVIEIDCKEPNSSIQKEKLFENMEYLKIEQWNKTKMYQQLIGKFENKMSKE